MGGREGGRGRREGGKEGNDLSKLKERERVIAFKREREKETIENEKKNL